MEQAHITVTGETLPGRVNPCIYGNFMEFLDNHVSGMWAEKLRNRKFEDFEEGAAIVNHWRECGYNNEAVYSVDGNAYAGQGCQKIAVTQDWGGERGILQGGLAVRAGECCRCTVYLRQEGLAASVRVMIGRDYGVLFMPYCCSTLEGVTGEWKRFEFLLSPDNTDDSADFCVQFAGAGTLWVDEVSLMPLDAPHGWRRDVVEKLRALKPNILRYPGGCYADTYHWKDATGDRFLRPAGGNYAWSSMPADFRRTDEPGPKHHRLTEPNDAGIDEFMALCEMTGSEALLCVNMGTGTPEEAAAWVEYCNGGADTPYGALRAANGRKEPYGIRTWQIGNEMFGEWEVGYCGADGYIESYLRFARAMKAADPSIRLAADGAESAWNRKLLAAAGEFIDLLDIHLYPDAGLDLDKHGSRDVFRGIVSRGIAMEKSLKGAEEDVLACGLGGKVRLAVCEWNYSGGAWGASRVRLATMGNAVLAATALNLFQRHSDVLEVANFSNLTNAWWASCIVTDNARCFVTPQFHVLSLYSRHCGDAPLRVETSCGSYDQQGMDVPLLDAMATARLDTGSLTVTVANRSDGEAVTAGVQLGGLYTEYTGTAVTTLSGRPESLNDFPFPEAVAPVEQEFSAKAEFTYTFPPCSLTVFQFEHPLKSDKE